MSRNKILDPSGCTLKREPAAAHDGGTGMGKTHLAIAIARACIRAGARGRFFNVVDLVNKLEAEARAGRQGRMADYLSRKDFIVSTSSAIYRSPSPAANSCSIWSAASMSRPR